MNRPNKDNYTKYFVLENDQYVLRGVKRYQEDLDKYCDELEIDNGYVKMHADSFLDSLKKQEKQLKFRDEILCCIGETLVDESKKNITTKCAIKRIREYMCRLNDERKYIDE